MPHHFIDSHGIAEEYSAGRYAADCLALLARLHQRLSVVVLTGPAVLLAEGTIDDDWLEDA